MTRQPQRGTLKNGRVRQCHGSEEQPNCEQPRTRVRAREAPSRTTLTTTEPLAPIAGSLILATASVAGRAKVHPFQVETSTQEIHPRTNLRVDDAAGDPSNTVPMTITDWIIDLALISVVLIQIRGRRLTLRSTLLPVALCVWAAILYLHGVPTAGNDLALVAGAAALGVMLGTLTGVATEVTVGAGGYPFVKAGAVAAVLWVAGVGARLAFELYATHGGAGAIARFSATHSITSAEAWVAALLLMAFGEVLARTAVVTYRAHRAAPGRLLDRASPKHVT